MSDDKVRPGEVKLTLDGDEVTLVPSAIALLTLSRKHGGLVGLSRALQNMEVDAFVDVIAAAVPGITAEQKKNLPEVVFAAGIVDLSAPLNVFLGNLARGGRPEADAAGEGEGNR